MKEGSERWVFKDEITEIGLASIAFILSKYLKKDFSEEIFLLIVLEEILFSFSDASQLRMITVEISVTLVMLYCPMMNRENSFRSFW